MDPATLRDRAAARHPSGGRAVTARRYRRCAALAFMLAALTASARVGAQWVKYRTPDIPRTADGAPNLSAPPPRTTDGKPDLSGMWIPATENRGRCGQGLVPCGIELPVSREFSNMGASLPAGLPYQPWAADLVKKTMAENGINDPHGLCLPDTFLRAYGMPHILKFVQTPRLIVALLEYNANYRQIFVDGRPLPDDPNPAWNGYSVGRWEGDTLVVDSVGFRDDLWLDLRGSPLTNTAKVRERISRPDFGHLNVEVTVDDAKAYTRPWTVTLRQEILADTEVIDEICLENEKFMRRNRGLP